MTSFFGLRSKTRFDDVLIAACLIDFLHPAGVFGVTFEWRHVVDGDVLADALSLVLIDAKTELDHAVPAQRIRVAAVDATVGLGVRESAGITLGHIIINKNHAGALLTSQIDPRDVR